MPLNCKLGNLVYKFKPHLLPAHQQLARNINGWLYMGKRTPELYINENGMIDHPVHRTFVVSEWDQINTRTDKEPDVVVNPYALKL